MRKPAVNDVFKSALPILFLGLLFCFLHREVLFHGKVYFNPWVFRSHAPFPPPPPSDLNPCNTSSDFVTHYLAQRYLVAEGVKGGFVPLWDTRNFCGFPIFANGSSAFFSPFNLLFHFMDPLRSYTVYLVLVFGFGACLLWFYLRRRLGLSGLAALAGTGAFMLNPHLIEHIDYQSLLGFVWAFPLVLCVADWKKGKRFHARDLAAGAVVAAAAITAHIHVALYTALLYAARRLSSGEESVRRRVTGVLLATAVCLAATWWLIHPMALFFRDSQWAAPEEAGSGFEVRKPIFWLTSVYPVLTRLTLTSRALEAVVKPPFLELQTTGFAVFLLALTACLWAVWMRRRTPGSLRFHALLWLLLPVSAVVRPGGVIGSVGSLAVMKLWQVYVFCSAVLAAFAVDLAARDDKFLGALKKIALVFLACIIVPVTAGSVALWLFPDAIRELLVGYAGERAARFNELFDLARGYLTSPALMGMPLAIVGVVLAFRRTERWKGALVLALFAEAVVLGQTFRTPTVRPGTVFPETETIRFLRSDPGLFRIMAIQEPAKSILKPNLGSVYGLDDVGGQESILHGRYLDRKSTRLN